ncbi:MAG: hypothetical protein HZB29_02155 [Nitrospinae bacterium]|nr:hypothetical protein [Nitrospinota bacterium]
MAEDQAVLFRLNADYRTGYGHLFRSMALAAKAKERGLQPFFLAGPDASGAAARTLTIAGVKFDQLNPDYTPEDEARTAMEFIKSKNIKAAVVDMIHSSKKLMDTLADNGVKILAVDDEFGNNHRASVIVNAGMFARKEDYAGSAAKLMLGPEHLMLRGQYSDGAYRDAPREWRKIFVSFGGSDPERLTVKTLMALEPLKSEVEVTVMVGDGCLDYAMIESVARRAPFKIELHRGAKEPWELMRGASLGICTLGNTTWELMSLGAAPVMITFNDGQSKNAAQIAIRGAGIHFSSTPEFNMAALAGLVDELIGDPVKLASMGRTGQSVVDGRGSDRVAEALAGLAGAAK